MLRCRIVKHAPYRNEDNLQPKFKVSKRKKLLREVKDANGSIVSSSYVDVPFIEEVPFSELANDGVTCEMFSLENIISSGIPLKSVSRPLYSMSLDSRSNVVDYLNSDNFSSTLNSLNQNQSE